MLVVIVGLSVFVFWNTHTEYLAYQEQNQLFQWTIGAFCEHLSVAGGLADWLGECLVQFFYVQWLGAALLGILYAALFAALLSPSSTRVLTVGVVFPALLILALLLWHQADQETLVSYPVALLLVIWMARGRVVLDNTPLWVGVAADVLSVPIGYWLVGPLMWVYVGLRCVSLHSGGKHVNGGKRVTLAVSLLVWMLICQLLAYHYLLPQYSLHRVLMGIGYYRVPLHEPALQWVIPLVVVAAGFAARLQDRKSHRQPSSAALGLIPSVALHLTVFVALEVAVGLFGLDGDTSELLRQAQAIRSERWDDIIDRAGQDEVRTPFWSNSVNLALAMRRQLANRQFDFYQSGPDALICQSVRDNMSEMPSAEAFFRLGLVNEALRYYFDLEQSILSGCHSAFFYQRLAQCYIANGNYAVARKYLDPLTHTTFYRTWAEHQLVTIQSESAVNNDPVYSRLRRYRLKDDFLFNDPEKDKIFGQLFVTCPDNKMALDYFMGQMLLDGNIQGFVQYMGWVQQYGGYAAMPAGYQDAWRAIQSKGQDMTTRYAQYARQMTNNQP